MAGFLDRLTRGSGVRLLHCMLCARTMTTKKTVNLKCGHSFCQDCLEVYVNKVQHGFQGTDNTHGERMLTQMRYLTCPSCHQAAGSGGHVAGSRGISPKHPSHTHTRYVRVKEAELARTRCGSCSNRAAHFQCVECSAVYCERCKGEHQRCAGPHHVPVVRVTRLSVKCGQHVAATVRWYCRECAALLCEECVAVSGHVHNQQIVEVQDRIDGFRHSMQVGSCRYLTDCIAQKIQMRQQINKLQELQDEAHDRIKDAIDRHAGMLKMEIDNRKEQLKEQLSAQQEQSRKLNQSHLEYVDYITRCMQRLCNLIKQLCQQEHDMRLFFNYKSIADQTNSFHTLANKELDTINKLRSLPKFTTQYSLNVGTIEAEQVPVPSVDEPVDVGNQPPRPPEPDFVGLLERPREVWRTKPRNMTHMHGTSQQPQGLQFLDDGTLVVAEYGAQKLAFYNHRGEQLTSRSIQGQPGQQFFPKDIAVLPDGKSLVVTDQRSHSIKHFSADNPGARVIHIPPGFSPCGIACMADGKIVVTDVTRNHVLILSSDGRLIRELGDTTRPGERFNMPEFITVDKNSNAIVISDQKNHCVKLFDSGGNYMRSFGEDNLKFPGGVAVDYAGNYIVADGGSHCVKYYSSDGQHIEDLVSLHRQGVAWPWGVACGNYTQLALSERTSLTVKVFEVFEAFQDSNTSDDEEQYPRNKMFVTESLP